LDSEDVCAQSGCAASEMIAARLPPAARITNLSVSICFSFDDDGFGFLRGLAISNEMETKNRLLQAYDEIVTIR
jgi:hypothetical protein